MGRASLTWASLRWNAASLSALSWQHSPLAATGTLGPARSRQLAHTDYYKPHRASVQSHSTTTGTGTTSTTGTGTRGTRGTPSHSTSSHATSRRRGGGCFSVLSSFCPAESRAAPIKIHLIAVSSRKRTPPPPCFPDPREAAPGFNY